jgi:hypothetical protein
MEICATQHRDPAPLPVELLDAAGYHKALADFRQELGPTPISLDAVIHGTLVRLLTNSPHWAEFWSANWFAPHQWATLRGKPPDSDPRIHLFALRGGDGSAWTGHRPEEGAAFLRGDVPYGPVRALALRAVAHLLGKRQGIHFIPAICAKVNGRGTLVLADTHRDRIDALRILTGMEDCHIVALDGVLMRYGLLRMVDGVTMLPTELYTEKGGTISGYRLFPWLEEYGYSEPRADARCLTPEGQEAYCFARDLDLGRAPEAFAYPLEHAWYVPTQMVAADPALAEVFWPESAGVTGRGCEGLENVPDMTPDLWERFGPWAQQAAATVPGRPASASRSIPEGSRPQGLAAALCRLRAAPEARAMAAPGRMWPDRAGGQLYQPLRIEQVVAADDPRLRPLDPPHIRERLDAIQSGFFAPDAEAATTLATLLSRAVSEAG